MASPRGPKPTPERKPTRATLPPRAVPTAPVLPARVAPRPAPKPVAPLPAPAPVLPDRPSPAIRGVWFRRGVALLVMPGAFLAWPLVLPIVFGLLHLGMNVWVAHIVAYVFVLGIAVLGVLRWTGWAAARMRFAFGSEGVEVQRGVYLRSTVSVPYSSIHEIHVRQGRWLRRQGLSTIRFRYRSGLAGTATWGEVSLPGVRDAPTLVAFLQARINRAGSPSTSGGPSSPGGR